MTDKELLTGLNVMMDDFKDIRHFVYQLIAGEKPTAETYEVAEWCNDLAADLATIEAELTERCAGESVEAVK